MAKALPVVEAALAGGTTDISPELAGDIAGLLDKIGARGGIGLKIAVFKAKMDLKSGKLPF